MNWTLFFSGIMVGMNLGLSFALYGQMKRIMDILGDTGGTMRALGELLVQFTTVLKGMGEKLEELQKTQGAPKNDGRLH